MSYLDELCSNKSYIILIKGHFDNLLFVPFHPSQFSRLFATESSLVDFLESTFAGAAR